MKGISERLLPKGAMDRLGSVPPLQRQLTGKGATVS